MDGLSAVGLADLAGATEAEVVRLVELGVLVAREGAGPFRERRAQGPPGGGVRAGRAAHGGPCWMRGWS